MSNTKRTLVQYTVEGAGEFPYDMLRYDGSFPASEQDSVKLYADYDERRQVRLLSFVESSIRMDNLLMPNRRRWESFLWRVVSGPSVV